MGTESRGWQAALRSALEDFGAGLRTALGLEKRDLIDELLERGSESRELSHERRRSLPRRSVRSSRRAPLVLVK